MECLITIYLGRKYISYHCLELQKTTYKRYIREEIKIQTIHNSLLTNKG